MLNSTLIVSIAPRGDSCLSLRIKARAVLLTFAGFVLLMQTVAFGDLSYPDFSSVEGITLVENAHQCGSKLRLTQALGSVRGAAWHSTKQYIQAGFQTTFQFQIIHGGGCSGDGFAFVIQNESLAALGDGGGYLGYGSGGVTGIANSLAVEFDTLHNDTLGDPDDNHISIHTRGQNPNSSDHTYSLGSGSPASDINDEAAHNVTITYDPGTLTVLMDDEEVLSVSVDLSSILSLDNGQAWVGFTAGTGFCVDNHDILSWSLSTAFYTGRIFFDDFRYGFAEESAKPEDIGWRLVNYKSEPPQGKAVYKRSNIDFLDDESDPLDRIMRLHSTTDGTTLLEEPTSNSRIETTIRFLYGTYAAGMRFTDDPIVWHDTCVQTFYTYYGADDDSYSECDFEFLAWDTWSDPDATRTMWNVTWKNKDDRHRDATPELGLTDNEFHVLFMHVSRDKVEYFLDGVSMATAEGQYPPEHDMNISFANWLYQVSDDIGTASRTYSMDVDWVFHAIDDLTLNQSQILNIVSQYREKGIWRLSVSIDSVAGNCLISGRQGEVAVRVTAPSTGVYKIAVTGPGGVSPAWVWDSTESTAHSLEEGSEFEFQLSVQPDTANASFDFWLYRQDEGGESLTLAGAENANLTESEWVLIDRVTSLLSSFEPSCVTHGHWNRYK